MPDIIFVTSSKEYDLAVNIINDSKSDEQIVLGIDINDFSLIDFDKHGEYRHKWSDFNIYNIRARNIRTKSIGSLINLCRRWTKYIKYFSPALIKDPAYQFSISYNISSLYIAPMYVFNKLFKLVRPEKIFYFKLSDEIKEVLEGMKEYYGYKLNKINE